MKLLPWIVAFSLLAACTPLHRPGDAIARANHEFAGRDAGLFFASYGSAQGARNLPDGGKLYRWISLEPQPSAGTTTIATALGNETVPGDDNGEMFTGYCEISIRTDADDRIRKLTLVADSVGKFSGSRCAEIFSQGPE